MALTENDYKEYVRWGTSTWTFDGWKNQIYFKKYKNKKEFNHASLEEYCNHSLFGVIGMDLFHYKMPTAEGLQEYAQHMPEHFPICAKVANEITTFRWPQVAGYGARAGSLNINFLNAELFLNEFVEPFLKVFQQEDLVFIFELMTIPPKELPGGVEEFAGILDSFLDQIPPDLHVAFEIRNKNFIDPVYFSILRKHGVSHCYNQWAYQHSIGKQLEVGEEFTADYAVIRALQPSGWNHSKSEKFFKPYDKPKLILPVVRNDIIEFIRRVLISQVYAYILVNNRLEGNAPITIREIDEMVYRELL